MSSSASVHGGQPRVRQFDFSAKPGAIQPPPPPQAAAGAHKAKQAAATATVAVPVTQPAHGPPAWGADYAGFLQKQMETMGRPVAGMVPAASAPQSRPQLPSFHAKQPPAAPPQATAPVAPVAPRPPPPTATPNHELSSEAETSGAETPASMSVENGHSHLPPPQAKQQPSQPPQPPASQPPVPTPLPKQADDPPKSAPAAAAAEEPAPVKRPKGKQQPPKPDPNRGGENVRDSIISDQRSDAPSGAHKTRIRTTLLKTEREEYLQAVLEASVLEAAVRPASFSTGDAMVDAALKSASSLPFRYGSKELIQGLCDNMLVEYFSHTGVAHKATPAEGADPLASTVSRSTAADLYLATRALTKSGDCFLTPLEQAELAELRQLSKHISSVGRAGASFGRDGKAAHKHASSSSSKGKKGSEAAPGSKKKVAKSTEEEKRAKEDAATKERLNQRQLEVITGAYRDKLCAEVPKIYADFTSVTLAASEKNPTINFLLHQDLEVGYNLLKTAEAELEVCQLRLKDEKAKRKEGERDEQEEEAPAKQVSKRGRVHDPLYQPQA